MHCAEDVWIKICQLVRTRVSVEMILVWIALIMRNGMIALIVRNSMTALIVRNSMTALIVRNGNSNSNMRI